MANSSAPTIAYYTVVDDPRTGWTGGLLLLNKGGRPLEFQCTLPVRPTRTHEILYGNSLRAHLIADVMGPLLIEKCRTPISMLCCDQVESLALAGTASFPVTLVREAREREARDRLTQSETEQTAQTDAGDPDSAPVSLSLVNQADGDGSSDPAEASKAADQWVSTMKTVLLAGSRLLAFEHQLERVRETALQFSDLPDAVEPFERIREAIKEAQSQITRAPTARVGVA